MVAFPSRFSSFIAILCSCYLHVWSLNCLSSHSVRSCDHCFPSDLGFLIFFLSFSSLNTLFSPVIFERRRWWSPRAVALPYLMWPTIIIISPSACLLTRSNRSYLDDLFSSLNFTLFFFIQRMSFLHPLCFLFGSCFVFPSCSFPVFVFFFGFRGACANASHPSSCDTSVSEGGPVKLRFVLMFALHTSYCVDVLFLLYYVVAPLPLLIVGQRYRFSSLPRSREGIDALQQILTFPVTHIVLFPPLGQCCCFSSPFFWLYSPFSYHSRYSSLPPFHTHTHTHTHLTQ